MELSTELKQLHTIFAEPSPSVSRSGCQQMCTCPFFWPANRQFLDHPLHVACPCLSRNCMLERIFKKHCARAFHVDALWTGILCGGR